MIAVSIIMPCHNRAYNLSRILQAYENQIIDVPFEIIAIDDASTDNTYDLLTSFQPSRFTLRVERLERNQGPAAARNRGIRLAQAPFILFVDDDILPEPDLVKGHLEAHAGREGKVAILGRVIWATDVPQNTLMKHIDGVGAEQFSYHYMKSGQEYDFRHFYTANLSVNRDFLCSVDHWFDTDFWPHQAFEDVELGFRLARRGLRIVYSSTILAQHYHYHTIWSFARRQYDCGLMAWLLARKHPVVLQVLRPQYTRLLRFLWRPHSAVAAEIREWLEAQVLHLTSFYEWIPHPLLDAWYRQVLDYFYYKGMIESIFGQTHLAARAHGVHTDTVLIPLLSEFIGEAVQNRVPLPAGFDILLLRKLSGELWTTIPPRKT